MTLIFSQCSFSVPESCSEHHVLYLSCLLRLPLALEVFRLTPFLIVPTILRIAVQVFCRSFWCDVSFFFFFPNDRLGGMGFGEKQCRGTEPFTPIISRARTINRTYHRCWGHILQSCPLQKVTLTSSFPSFLRKEVTMHGPQWRREASCPASLRAEPPQTLLRILLRLSILPRAFICSAIDWCQHGS